jgi:hypothetical protein
VRKSGQGKMDEGLKVVVIEFLISKKEENDDREQKFR